MFIKKNNLHLCKESLYIYIYCCYIPVLSRKNHQYKSFVYILVEKLRREIEMGQKTGEEGIAGNDESGSISDDGMEEEYDERSGSKYKTDIWLVLRNISLF